jgi:hypothetical protein
VARSVLWTHVQTVQKNGSSKVQSSEVAQFGILSVEASADENGALLVGQRRFKTLAWRNSFNRNASGVRVLA